MKPVDSIEGEDAVETRLLQQMAREARDFLNAQDWCARIDQQFLAYGVGGVVAVFLTEITPASIDVDRSLWVIVGDLPPAWIIADDNPTAADALDAYCLEMELWVEAIKGGKSVENLIPVNVAPTLENAEQLGGRLVFLRSEILPRARAESGREVG